ncbi:MAG: Inosine-5'-monophosphate dehydrogenase [Anaerolineae bacterium]|nr:Inosine-5'-monophosphate dehydrogenase [Anaerolineae bacterium]
MFVRNHMTAPVVTIQPDLPFQEALRIMREKHFRRLPVIDKNGRLIGIVSERDLLYASPSPASSLSVWEVNYLLSKIKIDRLMSTSVISTNPETTVEDAAHLMVEHKIGGLPVVDDQNRPIGIITETDIFRTFVSMFGGGQPGLRLTLSVPRQKGVLASLAQAVFELGGNILSVGSFPIEDDTDAAGLVIKVQDVSEQQLIDKLESLGDHVVDARECC